MYWEIWHGGRRQRFGAQEILLRDGSGLARVRLDEDVRVCVFRTVFSLGEEEPLAEGVLRDGDYVAVSGELAFEAVAADGTTYRELAPRRAVMSARHLAKDGTVMD